MGGRGGWGCIGCGCGVSVVSAPNRAGGEVSGACTRARLTYLLALEKLVVLFQGHLAPLAHLFLVLRFHPPIEDTTTRAAARESRVGCE